jgi:glyoxylase-like metal-dependent hydrolase (beta-lactamase superfamily II)
MTIITRLLGTALVLLVAVPAVAQQQDFSAVEITTQQVADQLYMLMGVGGNMAVSVGPDGAVLVDTEFAPLSDKIRAAVRQVGGGDIRFVINTHWHVDHAGGNEPFGLAGALIIAHESARARLSTEQFMAFFKQTIPPAPAAALPTLTFPSRATFHWNGNTVNVFHVRNAHTDGDVVVHFTDSNVFHAGDTLINGEYPFIDLGSNGDSTANRCRVFLARSDASTKVIPGHAWRSADVRVPRNAVKIRTTSANRSGHVGGRSSGGETHRRVRCPLGWQRYRRREFHSTRLPKLEALAAVCHLLTSSSSSGRPDSPVWRCGANCLGASQVLIGSRNLV